MHKNILECINNYSGYKSNFLYILQQEKLSYNHLTYLLKGKFECLDSPYLNNSNKILNAEDDLFMMSQTLYLLMAYFYKSEYGIEFSKFAPTLGNLVVTKIILNFEKLINKDTDEEKFEIQLISQHLDSKNRRWFKARLCLSNGKHTCDVEGCILEKDVHCGKS